MKSILFSALLLYIGFGLYLYAVQRSLIYFPHSSTITGLNERLFEHDGHLVRAAVLNPGSARAILYFGGNAENVDRNAAAFAASFEGYAVYLVNYRGYGGSSGTPSEQALYADALHIYDVIGSEHRQISVIGRSLGSAVATYLAANREIGHLLLITPFDSVESLAAAQFPIYPINLLLADKHDSLSRVANIKTATMIMAAEKDRVIGMAHTRRLLEGFETEVDFHVIEGAGHNTISSDPAYFNIMATFLASGQFPAPVPD